MCGPASSRVRMWPSQQSCARVALPAVTKLSDPEAEMQVRHVSHARRPSASAQRAVHLLSSNTLPAAGTRPLRTGQAGVHGLT